MKFKIYDNRKGLFDDDAIIEAPTARRALQKYLTSTGDGNIQFHNTADRDVVWQTTPFIERDECKYRSGRASWWGIKPVSCK